MVFFPLIDETEHLAQEERDMPKSIRDADITMAENNVCVQKIIAADGLPGLKFLLPSIVESNREWMHDAAFAGFMQTIPASVRELLSSTFVPNYKNVLRVMRDAPTLSQEPTDLTSKEVPLNMSLLTPLPPPSAATAVTSAGPAAGEEKKQADA